MTHPATDPTERPDLAFLDWPELLDRLAERAQSSRGAAACRGLPLAPTAAEARERMAELSEGVALLRSGESLPSFAFPEVEPHLQAVEKGVPLGAEELKQVAALCESGSSVRRFFARFGSSAASAGPEAPRLGRIASGLGYHDELVQRARETFDATGELRDGASPDLFRLRRDRDQLAARAREDAERLLHSETFAPYLQDQFVTLRADRFVLPLRASFKSMGLGIVHDTSRTGETVFIEPTGLVELNNRLKVVEIEIRRESRRILEELAATVAGSADRLRADREILTRLDVLTAQARLSVAYEGAAVEIVDEPILDLRALRHPLLALRAQQDSFSVTANDVALGDVPNQSSAKVLVISGPNAGGKTVLLKAMGLAALLARVGMHVPAAPGSRVGLFQDVLADIGDRQSVLGDLSSFSAHLTNLVAILDRTRSASPAENLLVLCDELMAGTHPEQGAALARATLEALADTPGLVVTTTHYDSLKALTEHDARFRNAGMEYDLARLRPTFRLRDGVPGRSYALDIAARTGMPEEILARARALLAGESFGLESLLQKLEERESALRQSGQSLEQANRDLEDAQQELQSRAGDQQAAAEALTRRERELAARSRETIDAAVRQAREAIADIVREARRVGTVPAAETARLALERTAKAATAAFPEPPVLQVEKLRQALADRALGVRTPPANSSTGGSAGRRAKLAAASMAPPEPRHGGAAEMAIQTRANTVDLRGKRADDVLGELQAFLDRVALEGVEDTVFVIHGHGTGALRKVVREYLATSPYVERFRPGGVGEGGDGVSVVSLRG